MGLSEGPSVLTGWANRMWRERREPGVADGVNPSAVPSAKQARSRLGAACRCVLRVQVCDGVHMLCAVAVVCDRTAKLPEAESSVGPYLRGHGRSLGGSEAASVCTHRAKLPQVQQVLKRRVLRSVRSLVGRLRCSRRFVGCRAPRSSQPTQLLPDGRSWSEQCSGTSRP